MAHRTAWHLAPENTLAGLQACIYHRCEWAEVDVRQTGDAHHVLMHDTTLDRTTDGCGPVAEATLEYIRSLKTASDAGVPTLSEAFSLARGRLRLYLDCRDVDPNALVRDIAEAGMLSDVVVCIEPTLHASIHSASAGQLPLVVFFDGSPEDVAATQGDQRASILEVPYLKITPALIEAARNVEAAIGCLSLGPHDTPICWRRVFDLGVSWIMTDFPEQLRREIDSFTD